MLVPSVVSAPPFLMLIGGLVSEFQVFGRRRCSA